MSDIKFSYKLPCCCMMPVRNGIFRYGKSLYCKYNDLFGANCYMKIGKIK